MGDRNIEVGDMRLGSRDLMAKKARMVDLVDYQRASVVSRTLIDEETGTVTLFALRRNHVHVLEGELMPMQKVGKRGVY